MPDDPLFEGLDAPRAMPEALRARIEGALLGAATMPAEVRTRVEGALALEGIDAPRALSEALRARIEGALGARPRAEPWRRWVAAAAAIVLFAAGGLAVVRRPAGTPPRGGLAAPAVPNAEDTLPPPALSLRAEARPPALPAAGFSALASVDQVAGSDLGPAPPYAFGGDDAPVPPPQAIAEPGGDPVAAPQPPPAPAPPPLRVRVALGDADVRAGFVAYTRLLNERGGVRHRDVRLVEEGAAIATVNLGRTPLGTTPNAGPLFEGPASPERLLRDRVFGFSSAPERQAHLVADAVFPSQATGARALVYHAGGGVWSDEVPAALETVLRARGVAVLRVEVMEGAPALYLPADAVFLSMPRGRAAAWLAARPEGYAPARGIAGVWSLADTSLPLPDGTRVVSPYALAADEAEVDDLLRRSGRPMSASLVHGWVTAKSLAVALWLSGADSSRATERAVAELDRYANGFAPPYKVREGTNSRTPEGLVYEVRRGALVAVSGFLRDPF